MDFEIWNLEFLDPFMDAPDCMSLKRTNVKESETKTSAAFVIVKTFTYSNLKLESVQKFDSI